MLGAGRRNRRVQFQRETRIDDGAGGYELGWTDIPGGEVWAAIRPQFGREQLEAGTAAAVQSAVVTVLASAAMRGISERDRLVDRGTPWQIRSIVRSPDNAEIELVVERGVAI